MGGKSSEQGLGGPYGGLSLFLCHPGALPSPPNYCHSADEKIEAQPGTPAPRPPSLPLHLWGGQENPGVSVGEEGTLLNLLGNRLQVEEGADRRGQEGIIT